jgi:hypothetical protein
VRQAPILAWRGQKTLLKEGKVYSFSHAPSSPFRQVSATEIPSTGNLHGNEHIFANAVNYAK